MTAEADTRGLAADLMRERDALFAGLTPDEVRVITGLVKAMRESSPADRVRMDFASHAYESERATMRATDIDYCPQDNTRQSFAEAAWHIAHAISQMAGDEDASRVLGERGR